MKVKNLLELQKISVCKQPKKVTKKKSAKKKK